VVSPEVVLTSRLLTLCQEIAARYAGTLGDVLRLAVPPRHATAEKNLTDAVATRTPAMPLPGPWSRYAAGDAFLRRVASGDAPAASWLALPGQQGDADWPAAMAVAAATALAAGRGALVVVPDHRDVDRVHAALLSLVGAD